MKHFCAIALLVAGTTPVFAQSADEACTAAKGEPPLVWYSSQDPSRNEAVVKAFKVAHPGLELDQLRLATGQLAARYASERDAGIINAGVISLADPIFIADGNSKGWFAPISAATFPELAALDPKWIENNAVMSSIAILGFAYNTTAVGSTPPKTWEDVLKPEYKGHIILGDPRKVPSYMALFRILEEKLGAGYLEKLAAQQPVVVPSVVPATQQLAAGEVSIIIPNAMAVVSALRDQGAPIEFVAPDLTTGNEFETMISAGGHSPNAAHCLVSFLLSRDGQIAYNGTSSVSPFKDIPGTLPMPPEYIAPHIPEVAAHADEITKLLHLE